MKPKGPINFAAAQRLQALRQIPCRECGVSLVRVVTPTDMLRLICLKNNSPCEGKTCNRSALLWGHKMTQFSWALFLGTLVSGLVSVTVSLIATIAYNRWAERQRLRIDCFRQLCRYTLSDNEYFLAFNESPVIFHDCPTVLAAHAKTIESGSLVGQEMGDFLEAVARQMKMHPGNRQQLLRRFSTSRSK